jgi:hypothetical protein
VRVGTEMPTGTPAFLDYHTTAGRLEEGGPTVQGVRCRAGREEARLRVDAFSATVDTRVPCRGTGL